MAIDAVEGKQKLSYMESRRKHLWQLLQMGMDSTSTPVAVVPGTESNQPRAVVSAIGTSELSKKLTLKTSCLKKVFIQLVSLASRDLNLRV